MFGFNPCVIISFYLSFVFSFFYPCRFSSKSSCSNVIASSFSSTLKCLILVVGHTNSTASKPKTSIYEVCPVAVLCVVLYVHKIDFRDSICPCSGIVFLLKIFIIVLFTVSTCPFSWGWFTEAKLNLILLSLQNVLIVFLVNCVSLSVMIWIGTPYLHTMFLKTNLIVDEAQNVLPALTIVRVAAFSCRRL